MSKRKLVITAITQMGLSQAEAARRYEVPEPTISRWMARYRAEGPAAFEPRSRRPKSNPAAKNGRGNHPQTQGKVERFQLTLKKWLRAQPEQPATITDLQALLDQFRHEYNHERPHRSLARRTPAAAYAARPVARPSSEPADRTHNRVRTDKVNEGTVTLRHGGRLHHIGLGRAWNGTPVLLLIQDLEITAIHAETGELIRELTLDPTKEYQPQKRQDPNPQ